MLHSALPVPVHAKAHNCMLHSALSVRAMCTHSCSRYIAVATDVSCAQCIYILYIVHVDICFMFVCVCCVCYSGLNHGLVQRLRSTWERVPHKHKRAMEVRP